MHPTLLVSAPNSVNAGERHLRCFFCSSGLRIVFYDSVTIERRVRKRLLGASTKNLHLAFCNILGSELEHFGKGL